MKTLLRRLRGKQKSVPPTDADSYENQLQILRQQLPDATEQERDLIASVPVSYTHLTLPTIYSV